MKSELVLLLVCLEGSVGLSQSSVKSPPQVLQEQSAQAQALYDKHAYAEAAKILEKLAEIPQITVLPDWPDQLYNLACDQALGGEPKQALTTLQHAVDLGTSVSPDHMREDTDLTSLHADPQFQKLITRLTRREAFWKDDPALATPYKPVLTEDEKAAGLSKFWSEARFNFPFFSRIPDLDWDGLYMTYLSQVRAAQTTADYYRVLMRFAAALHDGHTQVAPPKELWDTFYASPALQTRLVEDKVLVTETSDSSLANTVGDEVIEIDGQPTRQYAVRKVVPYINGFTPQDRDLRTYGYFLLSGPLTHPVNLLLKDPHGKTYTISVNRKSFDVKTFIGEPVLYKSLPGNIAYLAVNEFDDDLGAKTMRDNFPSIASAAGMIIDLRKNSGGSSNNGYAILSMLTNKSFQTSGWRTLDYKPVERAWGNIPGWWKGDPSNIAPDTAHTFLKPVIVLTNAHTYSAAEDFVVAFDTMQRGTLIGETTGGSTGQPLMFALPGGGTARICTKDDSYPDGRRFEGVGIAPQITVTPSVSDIRHGRDAGLEKALETLHTATLDRLQ